jgi:hypothetical protein
MHSPSQRVAGVGAAQVDEARRLLADAIALRSRREPAVSETQGLVGPGRVALSKRLAVIDELLLEIAIEAEVHELGGSWRQGELERRRAG